MRGNRALATSATMIVVNTPSQELALTNFAYCSAGDLPKFAIPGSSLNLVLVGDSVVLSLISHNNIIDGQIALNSVQRRNTKVSVGDQTSVLKFFLPDVVSLALLTLELDYEKAKVNQNEELDAIVLSQHLHEKFNNQVMTVGQRVLFEFLGTNYILTVVQAMEENFTANQAMAEDFKKLNFIERGIIFNHTHIFFEAVSSSGIKIINQREAASNYLFRQKKFNLQKLGIGGLCEQFEEIFRRAFASRVCPPHVFNKLGIKHVKGVLLYGPPGTGKTLIARQIGKWFNGREPKIVNGLELLNKYIGETEKILRDLFADAEQDQRALGDQSGLHIIIIDEIDAICKPRGSTRDGIGVHDNIVYQLLAKIDWVDSLNNVLLIGLANRKDLLDEALLRPGRLEVLVEIGLPDEIERLQILQIHTNKLKENFFLDGDINLRDLAAMTKNFTGAELEGVVKSAVSFALNCQLNTINLTKPLDENIKVTLNDFLTAIQEIIPAFGVSTNALQLCRVNGIVECGERDKHIYQSIMLLIESVKGSKCNPLFTCLLEGPRGSGKTAMAATIGIDSGFPFVKIVSIESMVGQNESSKSASILKVFEDAYMSKLSMIILDDIERLLDYGAIGPRYSNLIAQTLLTLLKKRPPKGNNLLVIGTTSELGLLESLGLYDVFTDTFHVPTLAKEDVIKVLEHLDVFAKGDIDFVAESLDGIPLKKLYQVIEIAMVGDKREYSISSDHHSGKLKIKKDHFIGILSGFVKNK